MSSNTNTNPLLVQNRAQLAALYQARQARINASYQRRQAAHNAAQFANFAAAYSTIHPALLFQTFGHMFGGSNGTQNPAPQQSGPQHANFQQPPVQTHALPHVLAIQNAAPVNPAAPPQTTKPKRKRAAKTKPKPKPKQPLKDVPFPLMDLPLEIRTMIYKYLLEENSAPLTLLTQGQTGQEVVRRGFLNKQEKRQGGRQTLLKTVHKANDKSITHLTPAILRICKTVHEEAAPILYGQTLEFEHPVALQKFLSSIGIKNRLSLLRIVLRGWQRNVFPSWQQVLPSVFDRLLSAENLKSITMDRHTYSGKDGDDVYDDPKDWKFHADYLSERIEYWAQCIDAAKGNGTARSLLIFSDRNFDTEDDLPKRDQAFLDRQKVFFEKLKLSYK